MMLKSETCTSLVDTIAIVTVVRCELCYSYILLVKYIAILNSDYNFLIIIMENVCTKFAVKVVLIQ
jgi:hypothetical protein